MFQLLVILAIYLPFQLALNPFPGVDLASIRILIIGIFLIWLAQGLKNRCLPIKNSWTTAFLLSFIFLNLISLLVAQEQSFALRKLLFLFSILPLYFVAAQIVDNTKKTVQLIRALVFGGALVSLIGIMQFCLQFIIGLDQTYEVWANYVINPFLGKSFSAAVLANPSWLVNIGGQTYLRATSVFPDPHILSFYVGLLIPLALGLYLINRHKKFALMSLVLLIIADILTFSRGGYLGLLAGFLALAVYFWKEIGPYSKIASFLILMAIFLGILIPSPLSSRFYSIFNLREGSNQGRIQIWKEALDIIRDHPFLGVGIGNYSKAVKVTATYREPIYAHNTYLDIAAESGIINAFFWISLIIAAAVNFYQRRKNKMFLMLCVSLIIFSVHSFFETAIYSPVVLTLFIFIISFANVNNGYENNYKTG
jgi:O-antigen ligase